MVFFVHFMLFATFIDKNNSGNTFFFRKAILIHLMFSLCFFYARTISNIF